MDETKINYIECSKLGPGKPVLLVDPCILNLEKKNYTIKTKR